MKQFFINLLSKTRDFTDSIYLFSATPPYNQRFLIILLITFIIMTIGGILIWSFMKNRASGKPPYAELRLRFTSLLCTIGGIGLVLVFFQWQAIPYLSSRLLLAILLIIFLFWISFILRYIQRDFSWKLESFEQHERYKKYLPRPKSAGLTRAKSRLLSSKKRRKN